MMGEVYILGMAFTMLLVFVVARLCNEDYSEAVYLSIFGGLLWFIVIPITLYRTIKTYKKG